MSLDTERSKPLDYMSDVNEMNYQNTEEKEIFEEMYKNWLKLGGLQHSQTNYKKYLEDIKEATNRMDKPISEEQKELASTKFQETQKKANDLLSQLEKAINRESNTEEEQSSFRL